MTEIGGNYDYVNWNFGVATGDARLGLEYNIGQAEASLLSAGIDFKIPIPFTDLKAVIGVSGKAFAVGASCYYDTDNRLNIGASALFGAGISVGLEN